MTVSFILFNNTFLFPQNFFQHRNHFQIENWMFYKGDIYKAERGHRISEQGWEKVAVPHTWNAEDVLTEGIHLYQGIGWYRSRFEIPKEGQNQIKVMGTKANKTYKDECDWMVVKQSEK